MLEFFFGLSILSGLIALHQYAMNRDRWFKERIDAAKIPELIQIIKERDELIRVLDDLVTSTELWNESVQVIIGRVPNTGIGLVEAKNLLARLKK